MKSRFFGLTSAVVRLACLLVFASFIIGSASLIRSPNTSTIATARSDQAFEVIGANNAVDFDGTNDQIALTTGNPTQLRLSTFTLETWFRRDGTGIETTTSGATGGGLLNAIPLITKGRGEADGSNVDMNYFLGIDNAADVIAADFESLASGSNHSILGRTLICNGVWYHAAVTWDGTKWQLFLNGELERELVVAASPRNDSIQHFGIATAFNSTGVAAGFFNGAMDDVRVWNTARTQAQIKASMTTEILSATGLVGSWALNEGGGTTTADSSGSGNNGNLTNGPLWIAGTPYTITQNALDLTPNTYVTMGAAPGLNATNFTLEAWVRRDAGGTGTATGTGGLVNAVPIVTKGRGEGDNSNLDMNYFLGVDVSTNALAVDFEEGAGAASPGLNHPFIGTTPISVGTWYHVAATYDGSVWRLYVNGNLDATSSVIGQPPRSDSIQHSAIGSALTSTGAAAGFFDGAIDEVRVWNVARTQTEIQANATAEISSGTGLIGRWGFNNSCGTTVNGSLPAPVGAAVPINGSITSSGTPTGSSAWVAGAPFTIGNLPPTVNAGPDQTVSIAAGAVMAGTASDDGLPSGILTTTWSQISGPGTATFVDNTSLTTQVNFSAAGVYVLRLTASDSSLSSTDDVQITVNPAPGNSALDFGGTNAYVTFGNPAKLHLPQFTIETRFRRDGTGIATTTGTSGITSAIPLVARGVAEAEGTGLDMNYFLGIDATTNRLGADFEERADGSGATGLNHPVIGPTTITNGVWHHAAATYDGTTWRLYLDGVLEKVQVVNEPPSDDGNQHASIGSALNTSGVPYPTQPGFFDGAIDEVRIWNFARSDTDIRNDVNNEITSASGLVARWGLNEATGTAIGDSTTTPANGTVTGANWTWIGGSPVINLAPLVNAGPDQSVLLSSGATMAGSVTDDGLLGAVTTSWSQFSGPGTATFTNISQLNTTVSFSTAGTYVLRLTGNDGQNIRTDDVTITVTSTDFTLSFREGVNGYSGTVDTFLRGAQPTTPQGSSQDFQWDGDEGGSGTQQYALVRFDNIFGNGAGQIPPGVFITSATLSYTVFEAGDNAAVNEAAVAWTENSTYNDFGGDVGVQPDEYGAFVDSAGGGPVGQTTINVTSSITAWLANPSLNQGWIFLPAGTDGVDVRSSEYTTVTDRPILTVTYSTVQPNRPPNTPVLVSPADGGTGVHIPSPLTVNVTDPDGDPLTVTYFGRPKPTAPGVDFTVIAVPDTQNYADGAPNGDETIFYNQLQWIRDNRASRNIVFVTQLGDCVQNGDNGGNDIEWQRANTAFSYIETPYTGFPNGIPYGIAVGNHDQSPIGDPNGTTTFLNQYFGESRFLGRAYYGGHYGSNNDNHYQLFSASGMDFIAIHLEYDPAANAAVLAWANNLLQTYPNRRGIVISHHFVNIGNPGSFGTQGQATYNALRGNPNLFLMLNGHVHGEGRRQDTFNGNTVNSLLSDYQGRSNGGDGWLRIMTFKPSLNQIDVQTYSTTLNQFETDSDSQFTLSYDMSASGPSFSQIGQNTNVPGLTNTTFSWPDRAENTQYEWYVTVSDGEFTVTSPIFDFRTVAPTASNAVVSGRVVSATGSPIVGALITMSNPNGSVFRARSNPFGYFVIDNVPVGEIYRVDLRARENSFSPIVISVMDNIDELLITADP